MNKSAISVATDRPSGLGLRHAALAGVITVCVISLCVAFSLYRMGAPGAVAADAPLTVFSSARALGHLQVIARAPHPIGSPENAQVRDYLVQTLAELGLQTDVQQTTGLRSFDRSYTPAGTVANVVGRIPGSASSGAVVLMAHYDSVPHAPGANDDGTAVAAILEAVRAVQAGPPLQNDLIVLLTDGEESGLLGAQAFMAGHPWRGDIRLVINFEARGSAGPSLLFETSPGNGWLVQEFARAAPHPAASSLFSDVYSYLPNDTDFSIFKDAGVAGLNFAYIDGFTRYHTAIDSLENVDERSLQHHGSYALALARHFGNLDLRNTQQGDRVFFDVMSYGVIHYPTAWNVPLLAGVALLYLGLAALAVRRKYVTLRGSLASFFAFIGLLVLVALVVSLAVLLIRSIHPEYRSIEHGDTYNSRLYLAGLLALTLALCAALYGWLQRRTAPQNIALGAAAVWLVFAALSSWLLPGGSYLFVWPLLFSLPGLWILCAARRDADVPWKNVAVLLLCALPALLLFAPLVYQLFTVLTMAFAGVAMLIVALLLGLLIPQLSLVAVADRRVLPGLLLLVSVACFIGGGLTAGFTSENPKPNSILYGLSADTGQAIWASSDAELDQWTGQFFETASPQRGPLEDFFPFTPQTFLSGPAPATALPAPAVTLLEESTANGVRTVRLQVASGRQAPLLWICLAPQTKVLGAALNGVRIEQDMLPDSAAPNVWWLEYWAPPAEGVELTLELPPEQTVQLRVIDWTGGLPQLSGVTVRPRPAEMIPSPHLLFGRYSNATLVSRSFTFAAQQ